LRLSAEGLDPGVDVVAPGGEGVHAPPSAPASPSLEVAEVGLSGRVRIGDQKGGRQTPERIGVRGTLGEAVQSIYPDDRYRRAELAGRQSRPRTLMEDKIAGHRTRR
jgi:hypothetical protein